MGKRKYLLKKATLIHYSGKRSEVILESTKPLDVNIKIAKELLLDSLTKENNNIKDPIVKCERLEVCYL